MYLVTNLSGKFSGSIYWWMEDTYQFVQFWTVKKLHVLSGLWFLLLIIDETLMCLHSYNNCVALRKELSRSENFTRWLVPRMTIPTSCAYQMGSPPLCREKSPRMTIPTLSRHSHLASTSYAPLHVKIISFTLHGKIPKKVTKQPNSINKVSLTSYQIYAGIHYKVIYELELETNHTERFHLGRCFALNSVDSEGSSIL